MVASNDNLHHNETKRQYSAVTKNQSLRPTSNGTRDYIWSGWSGSGGISAGGALAEERLQQVMDGVTIKSCGREILVPLTLPLAL